MAISGDPRVFATLGSFHTHPLRSYLPSSKIDFTGFLTGGSSFSEIRPKLPGVALDTHNMRGPFKRCNGITGDYELSSNSVDQEAETFLLNAINMGFFERLNLAWKIIFPCPTSKRSSNARIAKQRLKMILFSDRCAVSDEAKRMIVSNIVRALSDFVEIESQEKVHLSVSADSDLGTIYSVTVPVRRVKPGYQEADEAGTITNIEYKDTGDNSGSVDVRLNLCSNPRLRSIQSGTLYCVEMNGAPTVLHFENPISDAVSRIRFAPKSNNLLVSSWDSSLRLYDVDNSLLRLETTLEAALLDCCFQDDSVSFSADSDGSIRRYDLHSGIHEKIGKHGDIATCVEYSDETCQVITAGLDKKIISWDTRMVKALPYSRDLDSEVESMSLFGFNLMVAIGASINMYDLRNLDRPVDLKESHVNTQIRCARLMPCTQGFAVGSVDGRVEISYSSNSYDMGYTFRCHPKSKHGKDHLVSVNDIVFNPLFSGAFVTGDNEGYVTTWDSRSRRRLFELPRYPNSVASLSYNHEGQLLAIATSHTYQEANEIEECPQIFVHEMDANYIRSVSARSSSRN